MHVANQLIMGTRRLADHAAVHRPGRSGELEGTPGNKPGIGRGDGVMIAGDVRTLARQYCAAGAKVQYHQYDLTSHVTSAIPWLGDAVPWLTARFAGLPAPQNCRDRGRQPADPDPGGVGQRGLQLALQEHEVDPGAVLAGDLVQAPGGAEAEALVQRDRSGVRAVDQPHHHVEALGARVGDEGCARRVPRPAPRASGATRTVCSTVVA